MTGSRRRRQGRPDAGARAPRRCGGQDRGSAAVELTLLTPLLIVFVLFVVSCGRLAQAQLRLADAAHSAARAASLARDPASATRAASVAVHDALPGGGATCRQASVAVDTSAFIPGGHVTVTVTCSVDLGDLTGLKLPAGATTQRTSFTSLIDTFRSTTTEAGT